MKVESTQPTQHICVSGRIMHRSAYVISIGLHASAYVYSAYSSYMRFQQDYANLQICLLYQYF
jgi:hypothetical protein